MNTQASNHPLMIYGGGDHGLIVAETAALAGFDVIGFLDDTLSPGHRVGRWSVLDRGDRPEVHESPIHIAVGHNRSRWHLANRLISRGVSLARVVHPSALVSDSAVMDAGVYIGPGAIINAEAKLGRCAIINSGAIIEHHVQLGEAAHIAPGATLTGRVTVGMRSLIGALAVVRPGLNIGEDAVVGAGAVVVRDVPDGVTVVGVPAEKLG